MRLVLSTALLSLAGSAIAEEAIVGGTQAANGEFPYQVSVQTSSHKCGGSIIDNDHILTAAHCVDGLSAGRLRIRAGSNQHASGGKLVKVAKVTQHSEFDAKTLKNDIAVLKLASSLDFGPTISAVELPSSVDDVPPVGTRCSVTGWGSTSAGGSPPSNLLVAYVDIVDHEKCVEEYADRSEVDDSMICAGVKGGGKDACQGDSGGPLVDASSKKQVGVVSWGFGCGQHNRDGVYASTAAYLDWIQGAVLVV
ncbi:trypsin-like cysteine/serine peptidase domain-containing protein [Penicillium cataractarum]|uniref:Trypsin-like cysteine/serine peptidase domain-containing protein n=1 Tax=Penicillium cataractarum TaxID=2100454 RepID=A0A9W9VIC7_9EURO|nr:trypsin-like cysteine/serine peptidase domain-containing protein [Penicillium cataractarum]KAJ5380531.1 trypsin-like cysteine/serine peptidase domain-containing protein [Penicillium cataractarum]